MTRICRTCDCHFESTKWCHCATCHETFGGERAFDAHRVSGECQPPGESGLTESGVKRVEDGRPVWVRGYGKKRQKVSQRRADAHEARKKT